MSLNCTEYRCSYTQKDKVPCQLSNKEARKRTFQKRIVHHIKPSSINPI